MSAQTASPDFPQKFRLALEVLNYSRARCAQELGVHKSVVARWAAGGAHPTEHNLTRLTELFRRSDPGFTPSLWRLNLDDFTQRLGTEPSVRPSGGVERPAVAVLAFDNLSGNSEQDYFSDGIAEDIITELSRNRSITVIARNSSFTYRGRPVDVRQIGRELGARYVLQGSVRRVDDRVRISAQLIEAKASSHVWAERYDRRLTDLFIVQDEIAMAVVLAIGPAIAEAEQRRAVGKPPANLDAWEAYQRGLWHFTRFEDAENQTAQKFFHRAIELDPMFSPAYQALAFAHLDSVRMYASHTVPAGTAAAEDQARKAVALDPNDAGAHTMLGYVLVTRGETASGLDLVERALVLSPSFALAYYVKGVTLAHSSRNADGEATLLQFLRLNPRDPMNWRAWANIAAARYLLADYGGAVTAGVRSTQAKPDQRLAYRWLIAAQGQLGRQDAAQSLIDTATKVIAPMSFDDYVHNKWPWDRPNSHAHMLDGLRKAGWQG